jgi:cytidyltransferase-like protein
VRIAHAPSQLERRPRAVAIGTFDGVHRGHRSVLRAATDSGLEPTVITLDPHPRIVLGNRVDLISTLERRLELLADAGVADTLVAAFTPEFMRLAPDEFIATYLTSIGAEAVAVGEDFRFGHRRAGSLETLVAAGLELLPVPEVAGVSSSAIRDAVRDGDLATCHDVAEGGWLTAMAEACLAGDIGARMDEEDDDGPPADEILFGEMSCGFIVAGEREALERLGERIPVDIFGTVGGDALVLGGESWTLDELREAWSSLAPLFP